MPRQMGVGFVGSQLFRSAHAAVQQARDIDELRRQCINPSERRRMDRDFSATLVHVSELLSYGGSQLEEVEKLTAQWSLRTIKGEPQVRQLRALPGGKTSRPLSVA